MAAPCLQGRSLAVIKSSTQQIEFNFSESKHLKFNQYISSPTFNVGGYNWALDFYPHGSSSVEENDGIHASLKLRFLSQMEKIHVEYSFNVLDMRGNYLPVHTPLVRTFSSLPEDCSNWSYCKFLSTDVLETHFCKDGLVVISVNIRVLSAASRISDGSGGLCHDIKRLWSRGERFDVTFEVEGERISAHRFMLAARSPVFEAELYGPLTEAELTCIKINNMKAKVFRALLRFIYHDNYEHDEFKVLLVEFIQDLFAASDRYALEKLKVQCQQSLYAALSVDTVMRTWSLAEEHNSPLLKEKCLEFVTSWENLIRLVGKQEYARVLLSFPSLMAELQHRLE
ncbi:BTB/POZ/MATH-domain protein [Rhynchospora pubera]|uniref:BTB/POZ/MATH-domain protein n=1 Tax=Rhynchospora pubera TaxID=906938 RepID=A0AAV8ES00_9POAL|nr:BTB/POZ/MATH-domain protein [Rhynchospora pubera]